MQESPDLIEIRADLAAWRADTCNAPHHGEGGRISDFEVCLLGAHPRQQGALSNLIGLLMPGVDGVTDKSIHSI